MTEAQIELPAAPDRPVYFVSLVAGLESVVADEVVEKLPGAQVLHTERGRLFLSWEGEPAALLRLMTVEHVFSFVGLITDLPQDESGLAVIEQRLAQMELEPALAVFARLRGLRAAPSFRVTARRSGHHAYRSPEIAAAAGAGVVARYGWRVDLTGFDLDVRVYVSDDIAVVGVRLSDEALHKRDRVAHAPASLNQSVAHAMCRLSQPAPGEVFVDPMCGAGTILVERARWDDGALLVGGDRFAEPLRRAEENLTALGIRAALVQWDARDLPLASESVDNIVCNLPWGRRVGSHTVNIHLYPGFVRQMGRVLRPKGRAVLLTQEKRLITRLVEKNPRLELVACYRLSLSGLHPSIYVVKKRG